MLWGIDTASWLTILGAVLNLMLLEGLLSADNALVLAVMVRHLPKDQQKRALRFGIWGAFIFRLIAVIFASYMLEFWWLKVAGGLYLLFLALRHFAARHHEDDATRPRRGGGGFWATVVNVELADIAFSIDSILAAVALAEALPQEVSGMLVRPIPMLGPVPMKVVIVYVGGVLGIVAMRLVAGVFLVVLERFPGLVNGAYVLVGWIGVKLVESGVHQRFPDNVPEMPDWIFWTGMGLIILASLVYRPKSPPRQRPPEVPVETVA
jgi:YkoY family integral membrane protein